MRTNELTREEIRSLNRAWKKFENLVSYHHQSHSLKTCLRHETQGRGRYYAKILMLQEFAAGLRDGDVPAHALSISLGCLWARALGAAGQEDYAAHYPRDLDDFKQDLPAALSAVKRHREEAFGMIDTHYADGKAISERLHHSK